MLAGITQLPPCENRHTYQTQPKQSLQHPRDLHYHCPVVIHWLLLTVTQQPGRPILWSKPRFYAIAFIFMHIIQCFLFYILLNLFNIFEKNLNVLCKSTILITPPPHFFPLSYPFKSAILEKSLLNWIQASINKEKSGKIQASYLSCSLFMYVHCMPLHV